MKILLDENLPHNLRHELHGHDVYTVAYLEWCGTKNGELLRCAAPPALALTRS
jgi:predicted nuclease of predicted toxin-antitoxin system